MTYYNGFLFVFLVSQKQQLVNVLCCKPASKVIRVYGDVSE